LLRREAIKAYFGLSMKLKRKKRSIAGKRALSELNRILAKQLIILAKLLALCKELGLNPYAPENATDERLKQDLAQLKKILRRLPARERQILVRRAQFKLIRGIPELPLENFAAVLRRDRFRVIEGGQ
jgi:hypothetical protein